MRQAFKVVLIFNDLIAYNDECFMRFWGHFNLFWEFSIQTQSMFLKLGLLFASLFVLIFWMLIPYQMGMWKRFSPTLPRFFFADLIL